MPLLKARPTLEIGSLRRRISLPSLGSTAIPCSEHSVFFEMRVSWSLAGDEPSSSPVRRSVGLLLHG